MKTTNKTKLLIFLLIGGLLIFLSVFQDWLENSFLTLILFTVAQGAFVLSLVRQKFRREKLIEVAVLILISVFLLSVIQARVHFWSILSFLRWLAILQIFYLSFSLIEKIEAEKLVMVILVAATLSAIWGLYEFINSGNPIETRRFYGVLHTHVWTAGYFLLVLPIPLVRFLYEKKLKFKAFYGSLFALFFLVLVLTYARGAWISLLPVLFALMIITRKAFWENKFSLIFITVLVFVVVLFISSPNLLLGRAKSLLFFYSPTKAASVQSNIYYDTAFVHRTNNYKNALKIFKDNAFLGVGLANFGWIYHQYQDLPWVYSRFAHSSFLDILTETGILGFLAFIFFLGVVFYTGQKNLKEMVSKPKEHGLALGLMGGVTASLLHNFIDSDWHVTIVFILFMVELSLLSVFLRKKTSEITAEFSRVVKVIFGAAAVFFWLLAFSLRMSVSNFQALQRASQKGDIELAKSYAFRSARWSPYFPFVYEALGTLSLSQHQDEAALSYFKRAEALNPLYSENSFNVGFVQVQLGLNEEAEKNFNKALEKGPYTTPRYYNALAKFYLLNGEKDKAKETYEAAIRHFPYTPVYAGYSYMYNQMKRYILESYVSLAMIYFDNEETQKGKELLAEALKFDPENSQIIEALEKIE